MFFYDDKLNQWNSLEIKTVSAGYKGSRGGKERWLHDVTLKDGTELTVLDVTARDIDRTAIHVLPIHSGFQVITGWDDESDDIYLEPVLGWALTIGGGVMPITIDGVNSGLDQGLAIVRPDGKVQVPEGATYSSLEEYITEKKTPTETQDA